MTIRLFISGLLLLVALPACASPATLAGVDVLERDNFEPLSGQRIALITNHTGLTRDGRSTVRLLHDAGNVDLVRIFSPEHGFEGKLDVPIIGDDVESSTGLAVYSLYGDVRRPSSEMLDGIDTIVFDIQDIGTRFYTYISTMGNAMSAAAEHGIRFVVLDRPNPINGVSVGGPVLDDGLQSFVAYHTIAVRHGMTVGELAHLFRAELNLDLDLHVVRIDGWQRRQFFDDTGLTWVNPSPNMRSLQAALLYPGVGLLETTNISVGRGTATPFEHIGAPWLDGASLARALRELQIPGIEFVPVKFTPDSSTFANESCEGVRFVITDRNALDPMLLGFSIARQLLLDYRDDWETERYIRLLGNEAVLQALLDGSDVHAVTATYQRGLDTYMERRAEFLLYD